MEHHYRTTLLWELAKLKKRKDLHFYGPSLLIQPATFMIK